MAKKLTATHRRYSHRHATITAMIEGRVLYSAYEVMVDGSIQRLGDNLCRSIANFAHDWAPQ